MPARGLPGTRVISGALAFAGSAGAVFTAGALCTKAAAGAVIFGATAGAAAGATLTVFVVVVPRPSTSSVPATSIDVCPADDR